MESCAAADEDDRMSRNQFRFKKERLRNPTNANQHNEAANTLNHHHRRRNTKDHHRKYKRRKLSPDHASSKSGLPPDVAFRESLFDALGDDEGAAFWEGVYGQPIHNYSRSYQDAETGELETMDDEQYVQHIRRKMWEKSNEGIEAAREARRREQQEQHRMRREQRYDTKQVPTPQPKTETAFDFDIEASLKRGQSRRNRKQWQQVWQGYLDQWEELQEMYEVRRRSSADDEEQMSLRDKIAWPVLFGKQEDIRPEEVERFINQVSAIAQTDGEDFESMRLSILKKERVRWHPDKIQQRYGFMRLEQDIIDSVTAVFQILDSMWNNLRA